MKWIFSLSLLFSFTLLSAQDAAPKGWQHLSPAEGFPGIGTEQLYKRLPKNIVPDTIIVAVIDGGVDYMHEDLKNVMWHNPGEIPGNKIDDDGNGYIDDVYGWNFIGKANGENVHYDNLEVARIYGRLKEKFNDTDPSKLSKKEKAEYDLFLKTKEETESGREKFKQNYDLYSVLNEGIEAIDKAFAEKDTVTSDDLMSFENPDQRFVRLAQIIVQQMGGGATYREVADEIKSGYEYFKERYSYNFNPDYNSRQYVDDNYADKTERYYGNPDVKGPDASHGTHVAGIIGAQRDNGIGMNGVASVVKIMALRAVPGGDERDKDVANAIYYAVDNGATVINMSFGKGYSPYKDVVDKAVKYAAKKDVLLVHAAGNDGSKIDDSNNYPTDKYSKKGLFGKKFAPNWIEVGAA
ncbi:MAG: S8 family serine peptidase, partial [Bacteroidota bacterium]